MVLPNIFDFEVPVERVATEGACTRGENAVGNTTEVGKYLKVVIERNPKIFRIFSPDELDSNKLSEVFKATQRNYQWPTQSFDANIGADGGRVLEILSEHTCQAWLQGYLLTGRHGLFPSYEAFMGIITTLKLILLGIALFMAVKIIEMQQKSRKKSRIKLSNCLPSRRHTIPQTWKE